MKDKDKLLGFVILCCIIAILTMLSHGNDTVGALEDDNLINHIHVINF